MKPRIKQTKQDSRPFWAMPFWSMPVYSESGIAHLVEPETISDDMPFLADYQANYASACGIRYVWHELISAGSSGIGAPRCKRCMAAMVREENKQC